MAIPGLRDLAHDLPLLLHGSIGAGVHDPNAFLEVGPALGGDFAAYGLHGLDLQALAESVPAADRFVNGDTGRYHVRYRALVQKLVELRPELTARARPARPLVDRFDAVFGGRRAAAPPADLTASMQAAERKGWRTLRSACFALATREHPGTDFMVDLDRFMRSFSAAELAKLEACGGEFIEDQAREFVAVLPRWRAGNLDARWDKLIPGGPAALLAQLSASRTGGAMGHAR
jgi:hypothetical protein